MNQPQIFAITYAQISEFWRAHLWPHKPENVRPLSTMRFGGGIGPERHVMARLGSDVVAFERGGTVRRGVAAILASRARGQLPEVPGIEHADPLGALPIRSLPCRMTGMARAWMGLGSVRPATRTACTSGAGRPRVLNISSTPGWGRGARADRDHARRAPEEEAGLPPR